MNGLLGAQLGAQSGMTNDGVMGYADLIRKKLMETIAPKSAETLKQETPKLNAPKDYTAGLTPPEIGGVPSKLEFKATPNRISAFMVALGQIMQNKYNTDRLKEEQAQGLYESKLKSGQQMNQFQTELGMKEAAEARDPYRQGQIKLQEAELGMIPLKAKTAEANLANLLKRGERIGKTGGGGSRSIGEVFAGTKATGDIVSDAAMIEEQARTHTQQTGLPYDQSLVMFKNAYVSKLGGKQDTRTSYSKGLDAALGIKPPEKMTDKQRAEAWVNDYKMKNPNASPVQVTNAFKEAHGQAGLGYIEEAAYKSGMGKARSEGEGLFGPTNPVTLEPSGAPKKSVEERAKELKSQGKSKDETLSILQQEGY